MANKDHINQGLLLEYITLLWNVVGCVVVVFAAYTARSVALLGFGIDSLIEIFASIVVVWQLKSINKDKEKFAEHLICMAFLLLAAYILIQSIIVLFTQFHASNSPLGIFWLAITAVAMYLLAFGKSRVGKKLNNPVLMKEAKVTLVDGFLATSVLVGLLLQALFKFWWADPLTGFVIVYYGVKEGLHTFDNH
ncbi:MAG TPA: cation transporter [Patescibacteria group bacterium]|nr:cation transporter [Patescibacteria group bacterium]